MLYSPELNVAWNTVKLVRVRRIGTVSMYNLQYKGHDLPNVEYVT